MKVFRPLTCLVSDGSNIKEVLQKKVIFLIEPKNKKETEVENKKSNIWC